MTSRIEHLAEGVSLHCGDCIAVLPGLAENSIDACVTDPPYGLGFMGKGWDHGVPDVDHWKAIFRVLKPGAHMLAFGGTRTFGRLWLVIEEAGFEIRDTVMWLYGSGFPKSLDVSKAIDKLGPNSDYVAFPAFAAHYAERRRAAGLTHAQVCEIGRFYGSVNHGGTSANWESGYALPTVAQWEVVAPALLLDAQWRVRVVREEYEREILGQRKVNRGVAFTSEGPDEIPITAPGCVASAQWSGFGTALKPAVEPIILARKPLSEPTVAANVLRWGTGALNIDGCRVELAEVEPNRRDNPAREVTGGSIGGNGVYGGGVRETKPPRLQDGRWPANVILDGSDEVVGAFPESVSGGGIKGNLPDYESDGLDFQTSRKFRPVGIGGDSGSAARFFYQVEKDTLCGICCLPYGHASAKVFLCNVSNAASNLPTENTRNGASVLSGVADLPAHESAARRHPSNSHANSAESPSLQCRLPGASIAQENALTPDELKTVQNVKSAANLCDLCATDIARALVAVRQARSAASIQFKDFIGGRNAQILIDHLALYVADRENTDTILTTESLKQLFGSVFHAIEKNTPVLADSPDQAQEKSNRFWYGSKAASDDRLGSRHPTVKPLALVQYLCRLVTPPGGKILDCFAGTGTTGEAAFREGMRAILIEREPEYQDDIRRRMKLAMAGPDERSRESIKAKHKGKPVDHGPLFAPSTGEARGV